MIIYINGDSGQRRNEVRFSVFYFIIVFRHIVWVSILLRHNHATKVSDGLRRMNAEREEHLSQKV